ncbi:MAG: hypothetical protein JNK64_22190 [Myxococcales bacterium]|nr:hypothetical protein [Myxococcales bacterium]
MREPARPEPPLPPRPLPPARAVGGASSLIAPLIAAALLPPGWMFIAHAHRWHLTPSVIVLCLAWTAVVGAGYALVRAGNAFLDEVPDDWFTAGGNQAELEREKKSLVRAIKEIEFDRDTGKLSPADAAALLVAYRARAIEVIKALDLGAIGMTPRERILAEIQARAQLERQAGKAKAKAAKATKGAKATKDNGKPSKDNGKPAPEAPAATPAATADAAPAAEPAAVEPPSVDTPAPTAEAPAPAAATPAAVIEEARASDAASSSEEVAS